MSVAARAWICLLSSKKPSFRLTLTYEWKKSTDCLVVAVVTRDDRAALDLKPSHRTDDVKFAIY